MADRPRIAIIGPVFPYRAGIPYCTTRLAAEMARTCDVTILSFKRQYPRWFYPGGDDIDESLRPLTPAGARFLLDVINPLTWLRAGRMLRRERPDAVIFVWWIWVWIFPYRTLMALLPRLRAQADAGAALAALIKAALADEEGRALEKAVTELNMEKNAMPYDLDQFVSDCRSILKRDPGPAGREEVRTRLERLLSNKEFVEKYCGEHVPRGLKLLYEDPELGFQVLAHINDKARVSPPHDHGASWAIYGQATQYTEMTEWERKDDGSDPGKAKLNPVKKYRLLPGHAGIYQDGTIHSIDYPDQARFVRVTGTNLDRIPRVSFDLASGKVNQMAPQQAT